jgi:copper chaperone
MAATEKTIHIQTYDVIGMTCEHCVRAVIAEVSLIPGVRGVQVSLLNGTATVSSDLPLEDRDIALAVEEAGYTLGRGRAADPVSTEGSF